MPGMAFGSLVARVDLDIDVGMAPSEFRQPRDEQLAGEERLYRDRQLLNCLIRSEYFIDIIFKL